ncbi:helix-turn-helix domain-containing protein [Alicyclobacillus fodiniaquatilis]|uniref:Helix-turn-helix domain-containing protein n=1 Tax=Alicyclobacillus fodiniaquatilis TaxID=1661150 RepID=A0ABW4JKC2_9BACL
MDDFDLKAFREQKLNWTQAQLAEQMEVAQDTISRIENGSRAISLEFFLKLCRVAGMTPDEVLKFKISQPQAVEVDDVYSDLVIRRNTLNQYIEPRYRQFVDEKFKEADVQRIDDIHNVLHVYGSKPLVAFIGPSDAGKSRMINSLTGISRLLKSQWTPTTAVTVYVKHINDRPTWMEDTVWVFKSESESKGWNYRRFHDEEYCRAQKIAGGSLDILEEYCNRDSKEYAKTVDSAVVYVDSPILLACDIVDLPGFGTESVSDTVYSQRAREQADATVFLCQSNAFFNKHEDVLFLKEIVHRLPTIHLSGHAPVLSNLFVVASQAKFVGEENIPMVLERGYSTIATQISEELVRQHFRLEADQFYPALRKRFFTYAIEDDAEGLRRQFESQLIYLLEEILPPIRKEGLSQTICELRQEAKGYFEHQVQYYESVVHNIEAAKAEMQKLEREKYGKFNELQANKTEVIKELEQHRKKNRDDMRIWEREEVTVKKIKSIIEDKKYSKKQAQEYLAGNVSDSYYVQLQKVIETSTVQFNEIVTRFFKEAEKSLAQPERITTGPVRAPFDFKGALAGGLAGVTVLGGLGLWAGTLGNLGGYILVTQGVGLLSSLGISVGGGAAAVSAVAAIGGPVTIGIAIALGTFLVVRAVVGDGWKERLAKKLLEAIHKEDLLSKYIDSIDQYWSDTRTAIDGVVDSLMRQYEEYIQIQRDIVASQDPRAVLELAEKAKMMRDFFDFLPWPCPSDGVIAFNPITE